MRSVQVTVVASHENVQKDNMKQLDMGTTLVCSTLKIVHKDDMKHLKRETWPWVHLNNKAHKFRCLPYEHTHNQVSTFQTTDIDGGSHKADVIVLP